MEEDAAWNLAFDSVKGLWKVEEGHVYGMALFPAFFLQLLRLKDHVLCDLEMHGLGIARIEAAYYPILATVGVPASGRLRKKVFEDEDLKPGTKFMVYSGLVVPAVLYASETWTMYSRRLKTLEKYHQFCLSKILQIHWQDRRTNIGVLAQANIPSIEALNMLDLFHWTGDIARMPDTRRPNMVSSFNVSLSLLLTVNLMAIVILSRGKCGLSKCITRYLVAMATADLMVIVCDVIVYRIAVLYWWDTFLLYTPVCRFILFLSPTATDSSVWLTVAFTFDRFVVICCQKMKTKYCTEKTAAVVIVTLSALFCLKNIPWPFVYQTNRATNNIPRGCHVSAQFYIALTWRAFSWFEQLLTPLLPFCVILLLNALTVRRILVASRARRNLRDGSNGGNEQDTEMRKRRRSIVLLFAISGSFILLWVTTVVYFLYYRITGAYYLRSWLSPNATLQQTGIMLRLLSSCMNTAIYTVTQSKFREELFSAMKYPFTLIGKLLKLGKRMN
uniref:probable G-protein coupled receptor 139 n=1 Tax=Pristiophorus japonicus TaxID=55135 RepID=UPI00398F7C85